MKIYSSQIQSPLGILYGYADESSLRGLFFSEDVGYWKKRGYRTSDLCSRSNSILLETEKQLREYFEKKRKTFDLPLRFEGTDFQKRAWKALTRIPYGKTWSYRQQATQMGVDRAVRAVGSANGKNPISIIVPCHRVIRSDRSLGGYGGGLSIKERLLILEEASDLRI